MHDFENEYFFLLQEYKNGLDNPNPVPVDPLNEIPFTHKALALDSKPFMLYDNSLEYKDVADFKPLNRLPEILFHGGDLIVKEELRNAILALEIPNLAMNANSFIDYKKNQHDGLWYLAFTKLFYGWDKITRFNKAAKISGTNPLYSQAKGYSLNYLLLAKTPLQNRLLLKLDEAGDHNVIAHESIAYLFKKSGVIVLPASEYENYDPYKNDQT